MPTVTIKSDKPFVVIPVDEYESMTETIELLAADPTLLEELRQERDKIDHGEFITWADFRKKYKVK